MMITLQIIVSEDTKEYISYAPKEDIKAQDRRPFDLLVCHFVWDFGEYPKWHMKTFLVSNILT